MLDPLVQLANFLLNFQSSGECYTIREKTKESSPAELMGQASFNDFIRDMEIPPSKVELAGSRFRERKWLKSTTRTTFLRKDQTFIEKFKDVEFNMVKMKEKKEETIKNHLTYCDDLEALFELFNVEHVPDEWRLFLDGSTESLKGVLLHNKNIYPSIPIAYSFFFNFLKNLVKKCI